MARITETYQEKVVPAMIKRFSYRNVMQVPKLDKIIINMGLGEAIENIKILTLRSRSWARLREGGHHEGQAVDRSIQAESRHADWMYGDIEEERMFEFFNRLVNVALPKVRDFKGLSGNSFDGRGTMRWAFANSYLSEIHYEKVDKVRGMNIVIVTTARTDEEAKNC
jgi:large subunit ribosomal protein L5